MVFAFSGRDGLRAVPLESLKRKTRFEGWRFVLVVVLERAAEVSFVQDRRDDALSAGRAVITVASLRGGVPFLWKNLRNRFCELSTRIDKKSSCE
jgi:hypothetical protein